LNTVNCYLITARMPTITALRNHVYQIGGEVAAQQDLSVNVQINDGATNSLCVFTNAQAQVTIPWPEIQAAADQSNGSFVRLYRLRLTAAPVPEFRSIQAIATNESVRLEWQSYGVAIQVERAVRVEGPYAVIASNVTAQVFEDVGALKNSVQLYYRLRQ